MKLIIYLPIVFVLLIVAAGAVYQLLAQGEQNFEVAGLTHAIVAVAFGVLIGIHRQSFPVAILGILVVMTTPFIGILTIVLLDDKFNRELDDDYFESSENFEIGNPFISAGGNVEMSENGKLSDLGAQAMRRVLDVEYELTEREVEALCHSRSIDNLPLLEKIASSSKGEGRVLAQAAITAITDRTAIWSANLHRLQIHGKPMPISLERLAVTAFISLRKQGRNPQSFGLPEQVELETFLRERINMGADGLSVTYLFELKVLSGKLEEAAQLIERYQALPDLNVPLLKAKLNTERGQWVELMKTVSEFTPDQWTDRPGGVKRFWGAEQPVT